MAAICISVMNGKGGSGKTTTVTNLSAALAERGNRVCDIDLDEQGGLTRSLGIVPKSLPKEHTMYYALIGETPFADILVQPVQSQVHLAPANKHMVGCNHDLSDDGQALRQTIHPARSFYEYILIDCPPDLDKLTVNAVVAADMIVIPVQCEFLAYEAVEDVVELIMDLREDLPYYILPVMTKKTNLSNDILEAIAENYGKHVFILNNAETSQILQITHTVKFGDSSQAGVSILHFSKGSTAASQYRSLAHEILSLKG